MRVQLYGYAERTYLIENPSRLKQRVDERVGVGVVVATLSALGLIVCKHNMLLMQTCAPCLQALVVHDFSRAEALVTTFRDMLEQILRFRCRWLTRARRSDAECSRPMGRGPRLPACLTILVRSRLKCCISSLVRVS